ncbi:TMV resistance protein N-like isoform X2 [Vigna unguiculata]|uniref:TMV resistance protein N-like isoform X2 n=1 Tax=Vigna unguiculata TaxID=3917 RepID=UPI001016CCFB|nr:TMV resistance protein N-like isoform X2 [Vigna unguiculata]
MATQRFGYDVFLSFRGEDTRYGFTGNLYKALCDRGIHTFIDDEELQRGDEITAALMKAIEESRIAIVLLSQNYASSSFCLDELATILHCHTKGLLVIPLFYKVNPSDVRHHRGSYGEALTKHQRMFKDKKKLQKWKMALRQVADLSGYHIKDGDGYEYKFIGSVVDEVCHKINPTRLHVADYPVGLGPQVLEVRKLLNVECGDGFHMIGVHGMGGVGKTTLALAVYNLIADCFDGSCFIQNVREKSNKHGLEHLQSILLSKILGDKDINIASEHEGISMIQQRLQRKKVLLILDNVDKCEQLQTLAGSPDWFGPGSRVIITTRDTHLLASHQVKTTYEVKTLNKDDALQLLKWKAFKTKHVDPRYVEVLNDVEIYASGLPLALEVIGSNLFAKTVEQWKSAINQYKRIPNSQILDKLKVSFDALEEEEKCVFLDIACCFKGYELTEVEVMLRALYDDCMKHHISVLLEKSLIKIGWFNTIEMHELIEDMGRQIDQKQSSKEPGKRRRLWLSKDITDVLKDNTGTSRIEMLCFDISMSEKEETLDWNGNAFGNMKNLKILVIRNGKVSGGPNCFPESLRVLEWHEYPSNCLPSNFDPTKLVTCKLPNSHFTSFGFGSSKKLENLTELNFDNCQLLTRMPDVSDLPNLEKLSFERCKSLIAVEESIGFLNKLKILKAQRCTKLRRFPPLNLPSLEKLELSDCSSLENFPEILGEMGNIGELSLSKLAIKELTVSFQNLTGLRELDVKCDFLQLSHIALTPSLCDLNVGKCKEWKWVKSKDGEEEMGSTVFSDLRYFQLNSCNLNDDFFRAGFTQLTTVISLNLSETDITFIPECIKEFHCLYDLNVNRCTRLQEIRGVPPNLHTFWAIECTSLTSSGSSMLLNQLRRTTFMYRGGSIPRWFDKESRGPSISFWFRNEFPPKVLCLLIAPVLDDITLNLVIPVVLINGKDLEYTSLSRRKRRVRMVELDHIHLFDLHDFQFLEDLRKMASEKEWKHVEITYQGLFDTSLIKSMGIHIVKSERRGIKDIRYDDPYTTTKVSPFNFFITFLPFFSRFLFALILFISIMAYPIQL